MKIFQWLSIWRWTHVVFGSGYLDRLIVLEIKPLFSIYLNVWNTIEHDRFHTHAFPSISFMLRGYYGEEYIDSNEDRRYRVIKAPLIRWIPRTSNHRMLKSSKNAISLTFAGPWDRMWSETFLDGSKRVLSWGRQVVVKDYGKAAKASKQING